MIAMRVKTSGRSVYGLTGGEAWHDHAARYAAASPDSASSSSVDLSKQAGCHRYEVVLPGCGSAVNGCWTGRNGVAVWVLCKPSRRLGGAVQTPDYRLAILPKIEQLMEFSVGTDVPEPSEGSRRTCGTSLESSMFFCLLTVCLHVSFAERT